MAERGGRKRSRDELLRDRPIIAKLYLQGWTQVAIAEEISKQYRFRITQQAISDDLKAIRQEWRNSEIRDFDELKSIELSKIDLMECEAWQAWEASKVVKRKTMRRDLGDGRIVEEVTEETSTGNAAYLAQINKCVERRCKLLGLDAPIQVRVEELLQAELAALLDSLEPRLPRENYAQLLEVIASIGKQKEA